VRQRKESRYQEASGNSRYTRYLRGKRESSASNLSDNTAQQGEALESGTAVLRRRWTPLPGMRVQGLELEVSGLRLRVRG